MAALLLTALVLVEWICCFLPVPHHADTFAACHEIFLSHDIFHWLRLWDKTIYSPDFYRVVLTACLAREQRRLPSLDRFNKQFLCMPGFFIHQHREINIHIFIQVNVAEDDSSVKRGGVSGEFKVSSRELQASKAQRDCLDNTDNTLKKVVNTKYIYQMISSCFMSELEGQTRAHQKANTGFNNKKWLGVFAPPYLLLKQEDHREE